jgi:hypothetical protein
VNPNPFNLNRKKVCAIFAEFCGSAMSAHLFVNLSTTHTRHVSEKLRPMQLGDGLRALLNTTWDRERTLGLKAGGSGLE